MSIFSVSGLSSGIDFANMTSKMVEFERRPINLLESKQNEYKTQLSTWNSIRDKISELNNIAESMKDLTDLNPVSGSFSNNNSSDTRDILSVLSTGVTEEQDYDITVNQLAKNHRIISDGVGASETVNQGTFSITSEGTVTNFTITDTQNESLEELRDSINSAGIGVTASVINDGSVSDPYHLVLTADEAGSAGEISVQHSATPYQVMGSDHYDAVINSFTVLQAAQDAEIDFAGQTITRTSNTIDDLIDDTTIKLQNSGSGTVSFSQSDTTLKEKILSFVEKYNEVRLFIEEQLNYDSKAEKRGPLFGDSTLLGVLSSFTGYTGDEVTGLTGDYTSLAAIGITTSRDDGTLLIDSSMLDDAIASDFDGVAKIFAASGTSSSSSLVDFVDHTRDTASGTYTVYFTGTDGSGNVEGYFTDSDGNTYTATGSGRFLVGDNGLSVRIDEDASTSTDTGLATITMSIGVADRFSTGIYNLNTFDGRFYDKTTYLEDVIKENDKKIEFQEKILKRREDELKRKFASLEGIIGAMQGQSSFMSTQIDSLQKSYRK